MPWSLSNSSYIRSTTEFFFSLELQRLPTLASASGQPRFSDSEQSVTCSTQSCWVLPVLQMQATPLTCYGSLCFCTLPIKGFLAHAPVAEMHQGCLSAPVTFSATEYSAMQLIVVHY